MFFHGIILHDYRFFFEVPSFEESQDPESSPRRGEVGRPTLGDYGGFLLSFFLSGKVSIVHAPVSGVRRKASRTTTNKPPDTSGVEESDSPRKVLHV